MHIRTRRHKFLLFVLFFKFSPESNAYIRIDMHTHQRTRTRYSLRKAARHRCASPTVALGLLPNETRRRIDIESDIVLIDYNRDAAAIVRATAPFTPSNILQYISTSIVRTIHSQITMSCAPETRRRPIATSQYHHSIPSHDQLRHQPVHPCLESSAQM